MDGATGRVFSSRIAFNRHAVTFSAHEPSPIGLRPDPTLGESPSRREFSSKEQNAIHACPAARFFYSGIDVMHDHDPRFRLSIPIEEAFAFAMGESDLHYAQVTDEMRQVIGLLVIDTLEYGEQWRVAAEARACLAARWPECFTF
jgi:hypothetical protein